MKAFKMYSNDSIYSYHKNTVNIEHWKPDPWYIIDIEISAM